MFSLLIDFPCIVCTCMCVCFLCSCSPRFKSIGVSAAETEQFNVRTVFISVKHSLVFTWWTVPAALTLFSSYKQITKESDFLTLCPQNIKPAWRHGDQNLPRPISKQIMISGDFKSSAEADQCDFIYTWLKLIIPATAENSKLRGLRLPV